MSSRSSCPYIPGSVPYIYFTSCHGNEYKNPFRYTVPCVACTLRFIFCIYDFEFPAPSKETLSSRMKNKTCEKVKVGVGLEGQAVLRPVQHRRLLLRHVERQAEDRGLLRRRAQVLPPPRRHPPRLHQHILLQPRAAAAAAPGAQARDFEARHRQPAPLLAACGPKRRQGPPHPAGRHQALLSLLLGQSGRGARNSLSSNRFCCERICNKGGGSSHSYT